MISKGNLYKGLLIGVFAALAVKSLTTENGLDTSLNAQHSDIAEQSLVFNQDEMLAEYAKNGNSDAAIQYLQTNNLLDAHTVQGAIETALEHSNIDFAIALLSMPDELSDQENATAFNIMRAGAETGFYEIATMAMDRFPYDGLAVQEAVETALKNQNITAAENILRASADFQTEEDATAFNILRDLAESGFYEVATLAMKKLPYDAASIQNAVETALEYSDIEFAEHVLQASRPFSEDDNSTAFNIMRQSSETGFHEITVLAMQRLPYDAVAVQEAVETAFEENKVWVAEAVLEETKGLGGDTSGTAYNIIRMAKDAGLSELATLASSKFNETEQSVAKISKPTPLLKG